MTEVCCFVLVSFSESLVVALMRNVFSCSDKLLEVVEWQCGQTFLKRLVLCMFKILNFLNRCTWRATMATVKIAGLFAGVLLVTSHLWADIFHFSAGTGQLSEAKDLFYSSDGGPQVSIMSSNMFTLIWWLTCNHVRLFALIHNVYIINLLSLYTYYISYWIANLNFLYIALYLWHVQWQQSQKSQVKTV